MKEWYSIKDYQPEEGELVLIYDSHNYNGMTIKHFIGIWDENENGFIHHTGYKYVGDYWMKLSTPDENKRR